MKIETNDWMTMVEACGETGIAKRTLYNVAKRLNLVREFFGTLVVRRKDLPKIVAGKKTVGNPDWIESYDKASASGLRAVESRLKRIAEQGMTEAEMRRGAKIKGKRRQSSLSGTTGTAASSPTAE
jgi:hypothetical protein